MRHDSLLRDRFLMHARDLGGDVGLFVTRLRQIWQPSRKSMYPGFFVYVLTEFEALRLTEAQGAAAKAEASERKPRARALR